MARQPKVAFGPATVSLPAGGFLQAVPQAEAAMVARALAGTYSVTRHVEHVILWVGLSNCPSSNLGVSSQLPRGDLLQALVSQAQPRGQGAHETRRGAKVLQS